MKPEVCKFTKTISLSREINPTSALQILFNSTIINEKQDSYEYVLMSNANEDTIDQINSISNLIHAKVFANKLLYPELYAFPYPILTEDFEIEIVFIKKDNQMANWTINIMLESKQYSIITKGLYNVEILKGNIQAEPDQYREVYKITIKDFESLGRVIISH